ncbi:hypothetical protein VF14_18890 [Nostoc linckia z18]|uniref:Uncharacterized protein n=2 Tax=Nostoc linckia TaxID=92942 RepID=A0A9Q5ZB96_NOSLI|nr:hypothetical protein VF02_27610 [Nostoc linckia z1]PHJ60741.1 hypothetical protein VF05_30020 [Nostoc linckia z3]PHJ65760.1 hypothetical protein VF03_27520 [Nostoc linckia z2]PHJ77346.1 hypothetical protein VF06_30360 [Nostoc linckia z4]PHJ81847.1 hypothetical protein VF07_29645 [Nostoc linckia z6]PHJ94556.1 hypothetical protein VF04_21880 [Nostoc linckia z7]PHK02881.1 hypothetical protein VF08_17240 [Nostoc linckia z8]PHK09438.1 hypothetical protein VF09_15570 [Nostoc linckia z9]PHK1943
MLVGKQATARLCMACTASQNPYEKSTKEVLPLLYLCYQHSASLFGFRWKAEDGGIEPPGVALL